jgi:hypothetical protein
VRKASSLFKARLSPIYQKYLEGIESVIGTLPASCTRSAFVRPTNELPAEVNLDKNPRQNYPSGIPQEGLGDWPS